MTKKDLENTLAQRRIDLTGDIILAVLVVWLLFLATMMWWPVPQIERQAEVEVKGVRI